MLVLQGYLLTLYHKLVGETTKGLCEYMFINSEVNGIASSVVVSNTVGSTSSMKTVSSEFSVTLSYSSAIVTSTIVTGAVMRQRKYLGNLLPSGIPLPVSWLIIPIEIVSLTSRIISLAVRLSANIISGHTLTHMISNFVAILVTICNIKGLSGSIIISTIINSLLSILSGVELGIGLLQGYVLALLTCSYINDSLSYH